MPRIIRSLGRSENSLGSLARNSMAAACKQGRAHVTEWTTNMVEDRLLEAADVLTRLPDVRVHGYYGLWPKMILQFSDLVGQEPPKLRRPPPSPETISRMEQTVPWLTWLEPRDAKLVWARAERSPWKVICWRFGISRATARSPIGLDSQGQQARTIRIRAELPHRYRECRDRGCRGDAGSHL